jgi:hypothetical protein
MSQKVFSMRLAGLLVAFVLVAGAWSAAQARIHSLSGNARFQMGVIQNRAFATPIGFTPVPDGKVKPIAGATIRQRGVHVSFAPAEIVINPFQLTGDPQPFVLPVFNNNPNVFQVRTDLTVRWPKQRISFRALGRTGPPTVTFCGKPPSTTIITGGANPACAGGPAGTGLLRYTATSNQFGGPAQGLVGGVADVALRGGSSAPCAGPPGCVVAFFNATPPPTQAVGAMFGFTNNTLRAAPSPGVFFANVGPGGTVLTLLTPLSTGLTNAGTSWGGPWTTGMITVSQPSRVPPELFMLSGSDGRAAGYGIGSLSLVAGGFSQRSIAGPDAGRGWLNFTIGPEVSQVPSLPLYGMATLVGLTALSGAYVLRRRRNQ